MGTIEEIINAVDTELIECGKDYLTLGQVNKLLVNQGIISITEKSEMILKKMLIEKKIPNAYQTENTPKQWRIQLSDEGKLRKKTIKKINAKKQVISTVDFYQNQYDKTNQTICPNCGLNLIIPKEIINENIINCLTCGRNFQNPFHNSNNTKLGKTQKNWSFAIIFVIVLLIIISFLYKNNNDSKGPANYSNDASNNNFSQNTPIENDNSIDLNEFTGLKFTYKSTFNDKEFNGEIVQTNYETTYHTFDFVNMTVTQKSPLNGQWVTITYPMKRFYKEKGILASTNVIIVNQLGVKEIWFCPEVPNLGYDYDDGSRIACYNVIP